MLEDNVVQALTISISELDRRLLVSGIVGWRTANGDIDDAISAENWGAIDRAQNDRASHANTIALIFHKYTDTTTEQGAHA